MKVIDTEIEGVKIIEPDVFDDQRGGLCESNPINFECC